MPRHPKISDRIAGDAVLLKTIQTYLWCNDSYKLFFSKHHTNNPNEFWLFLLDTKTGTRKHGKYKLITDGVIVCFFSGEYKAKELENMRRYDIILLQLVNTENELDIHNFMATPMPVEKGVPYKIE